MDNPSTKWTFPGIGVVVISDPDGSVSMIGDEEMYTEPAMWNAHDIKLPIPNWSQLHLYLASSSSTAKSTPCSKTEKSAATRLRLLSGKCNCVSKPEVEAEE